MLTEVDNFTPKKPLFNCENCKFITANKKDFYRHVETLKHKKMCLVDKTFTNEGKPGVLPIENPLSYNCSCGRLYKSRQGLYKHKKICSYTEKNESIINDDIMELTDKELILMLVKQNAEIVKENSELKNMMFDVIKNGTHNTTNNNYNNKTFNLQVFLNETCKDAMNIMDFVDSIKLELSDLESVGELGYVKGLSNIIVKNLRALDVTKRPVHCSDAKREVLYIKDNDVWEKEDPENPKMKKAVKYIAYKNTKLLPLWKQKYPECTQYESSKSDQYNYMLIEAMGGMGDNESEKINKIIKQIAKEVVIEK